MIYLFGNWKMYLDLEESVALVTELCNVKLPTHEYVTLGIFPNPLAFVSVRNVFKGSTFFLGAQNVGWTSKGAYTGSISAELYKNAGATYALVGHSERRYIFNETNEAVRKKVEACLDAGIIPVVCIGETQKDKDANKKEYRLKKQIMKVFEGLSLDRKEIIIAYEPVWAIWPGTPCNPEEARDTHELIHAEIAKYTDTKVPVIYGGSVNAENVEQYLSLNGVDGVLPGHASTKIDTFVPLIEHVIGLFRANP